MSFSSRKEKVIEEFQKLYKGEPTIWVRAPGRVGLMGSHTDYNDGFVLAMAIDRDVWIAARPRTDHKVQISSMNIQGKSFFDLNDICADPDQPWTNYVRGVAYFAKEQGLPLRGFDGLIHSTVPLASGVSSSAALEVSTATLFKELCAWNISPVELALLCQRAENDFVGMSCGILDQYISALGKSDRALMLDCRNLTSEDVPIHPDIGVVICDTNAKRELTGSEYPERREQCEAGAALLAEHDPKILALRDVTPDQFEEYRDNLPEVIGKRCQFIVEEIQRVLDMSIALPAGNEALGPLSRMSYLGARDLYEIGVPEMEVMMNAMLSGPGVIGARQTGAGFGGGMVAFVHKDRVKDFIHHVSMFYHSEAGIEPNIYPVIAVDGAGLLKL